MTLRDFPIFTRHIFHLNAHEITRCRLFCSVARFAHRWQSEMYRMSSRWISRAKPEILTDVTRLIRMIRIRKLWLRCRLWRYNDKLVTQDMAMVMSGSLKTTKSIKFEFLLSAHKTKNFSRWQEQWHICQTRFVIKSQSQLQIQTHVACNDNRSN